MRRSRSYSNGGLYRPPRGRYRDAVPATFPAFSSSPASWPSLWESVKTTLRQRGFQDSTLRLYHQVLRSFRRHLATTSSLPLPAMSHVEWRSSRSNSLHDQRSAVSPLSSVVSSVHIHSFINALVAQQVSASWLSTNIAVLRTVFDKLQNHNWTRSIRTPKCPFSLPCILSAGEVDRMIAATPAIRDRLLIGFLHGCGMKTGEVSRLRWCEIDLDAGVVIIPNPHSHESRFVALPKTILPVLIRGKAVCKPDDFLFPGAKEGTGIADRTIERAIRRSASVAGLVKPVNCLTLRHSYAIACLKAGNSICELQLALGHKNVETTMMYQDMLIASQITSPGSQLNLVNPAPDSHINSPPSCVSGFRSPPSAFLSSSSPCNSETLHIDYNIDPDVAVFPFAEIPFDFRTVFRSIRSFFRAPS